MADIFREVDEDIRRDRLKSLWEQYGTAVIAAIVTVVVLVAGYKAWEYFERQARLENAAAFLDAAEKDGEERVQALAALSGNVGDGYGVLTRLERAIALHESDPAAALAALDDLAGDTSVSEPFRQFAAAKAALIASRTEAPDTLLARVEPMFAQNHPYRFTARELAAIAALELGDTAAARGHAEVIAASPLAPDSLRERADILIEIIGGAEG